MKMAIVTVQELEEHWKKRYEDQQRQIRDEQIERLRKKASNLGFDLVPRKQS